MSKSTYDMSPQAALSFLIQQAAHIETEVYRREYPEFKYTQFVPLDNSASEWTQSVMFSAIDARGELKTLGPTSTDVPTVDIAASQGFHKIETAALGYTYSLEDIGFAQLNGTNLDAERAIAVRDVVEKGLNNIYLWGHDGIGEGLYTSKNVTIEAAGATLKALVADIPTKGTQPIIDFFANAYSQVYLTNTKTVHKPTHFVMTPDNHQLLMRTLLSSHNSSNVTLLEFLKTNFSDMEFHDDLLLDGIGTGKTDRMIVYKKDMRIVKGHDVMPLNFLAPATTDNINYKVAAILRTGGTEWRIPKAAHYIDGA